MRRTAFRRFSPLALLLICGCATQPEFDRRTGAPVGRPATAPYGVPAETSNTGTSPTRRPDLADMVAGVYDGDVISDARGSSRSNVRLTVVKPKKAKTPVGVGAEGGMADDDDDADRPSLEPAPDDVDDAEK